MKLNQEELEFLYSLSAQQRSDCRAYAQYIAAGVKTTPPNVYENDLKKAQFRLGILEKIIAAVEK